MNCHYEISSTCNGIYIDLFVLLSSVEVFVPDTCSVKVLARLVNTGAPKGHHLIIAWTALELTTPNAWNM
jgi:hypothetical protein